MDQQRFDLRRKNDNVVSGVVVHRLDSESVPGDQQALPPPIPNGESKHAPELLHAIVAELFICVNNGFRIRARRELMSSGKQVRAQISEVIDLTVKDHNNGAIFVEHRLLASAQVDDAQASMTKPDVVLNEISTIVRTAMRLSRRHAMYESGINWVNGAEIDDPANPAHKPFLPALRVR